MTWPSAGVAFAAVSSAAGEAGGASWACESAAATARMRQEFKRLRVFIMEPSFPRTKLLQLMSLGEAAAMGLALALVKKRCQDLCRGAWRSGESSPSLHRAFTKQ